MATIKEWKLNLSKMSEKKLDKIEKALFELTGWDLFMLEYKGINILCQLVNEAILEKMENK